MGRKIPKISPDIISNSIPSYNSDLVKTLPEFKPLAGRLKLDLNSSGGGTQRRRQMLMMRSSHIGGGGKSTTNKDPKIFTAHHFGKNEKQNFVASIPYKQSFDSDLIVEGGGGGKGNKDNHNNNRRMLKALKNRENKDSMEKALTAAVEKNVQQQNVVIPKLKILRKVVKKVVSTPLPPTTMLLSKSSNSEVST